MEAQEMCTLLWDCCISNVRWSRACCEAHSRVCGGSEWDNLALAAATG